MKKYKSLEEFIYIQEELLQLEQNAEVQERHMLYENCSVKELEKRGVCVRYLTVAHQKTGMYGRFLVKFILPTLKCITAKEDVSAADRITTHKLTPGDIIGLYPNKSEGIEPLSTGVVTNARRDTISVAFNEDFDTNTCHMYKMMILTNDITYRRLKSALASLKRISSTTPCLRLVDLLFPCQVAGNSVQSTNPIPINFFNEKLDDSQKKAVEFALTTSSPICVIHGPPGTGKSTTVIEVIQQAVKAHSMKVLVCAPSNIAVDNLVEKLASKNINIVRLGHPARVLKEVQKLSLDAILTSRDSSDIIKNVRADISSTIGKFKKCKGDAEIHALRREMKELRKELVDRESKAIKEVLSNANVILSTTTSASKDGPLKHLPIEHFDLLVIDEAAQAMEISCWIPLQSVSRCILAGDHKQLPPTIISKKAAKKGLEVTLLERVVKGVGENVVCMLTTQYRMHEKIMRWPSKKLYHDRLTASPSVATHLLCDLEGVENIPETNEPVIFVDTAGCSMYELQSDEKQSKGNNWEVDIVSHHVDTLVSAGVKMMDIGVITPYNLQVDCLRKAIYPNHPLVEIRSVDGFQGREKEAILISMVRSNDNGEVGFLAEDRRINVAITRARRHLFMVADSFTISKHPFLASLCEYLQQNCDVRSAQTNDNIAVSSIVMSTEKFELPKEMLNMNKNNGELCKEASPCKIEPKSPVHVEDKTKRGPKIAEVKRKTQKEEENVNSKIQDKRHHFEEQINNFVKSNNLTLSFPSHLSSKERLMVHEIAEELRLHHSSEGEGNLRKIVVRKQPVVLEAVQPEIPPVHTKCHICSVIVPTSNFDLHVLRCEKHSLSRKEHDVQSPTKKTTKKKKLKKKSEEEDIDALLESFSKENSKCVFSKCPKSIKTLGQKCQYCQQMFCLSHHMAEIHGCGNAAKVKARQDISKYQGSKPHPMNNIKKAQLQRKLDNKLNNMEDERKKKSKDSKK